MREASAIGWHYPDLEISKIYTRWIYLEPGEGVLCWTSNTSVGADPAMHLTTLLTWDEVAFANDMSSSPEVLLTYTEPSSTSGNYYRVTIRSDQNLPNNVAAQGATDLSCWFTSDGDLLDVDDVPVGGFLAWSPVDPGGVLETAQRPGGPTSTVLIRMTTDRHIIDSDSNSGLGSMSRIEPNVSQFESYTTVVGVYDSASLGRYNNSNTDGNVQFYGNDLGPGGNNDHDGDGLGADLESLLKTCDSTTTHAYCSTIPNLQDSDGDGLRDDWEVFGEDRIYPTSDNLFPYWGANPAQKDVFVEVDYLGTDDRTDKNEIYVNNPYLLMSYPERKAWFDAMSLPYSLGSAGDVRNRNGSVGIYVHVDTGVNPHPAFSDGWEYAGKFGDWGGAGDPVRYVNSGSNDDPNYVRLYKNTNNFDPGRYGRFHYAVAYNGGGGQARVGYPPAFHFGALTSHPKDIGASNFAHELGHSFTLLHNFDSKEPNCNPIYLSLMNYRYELDFPLRFSASEDYRTTTINPSALREYNSLGIGNRPLDLVHPGRYLEMLLRAPHSSPASPIEQGTVSYAGKLYDGEYVNNPPIPTGVFQIYALSTTWSVDWNQDGRLGGGSPYDDPAVRSMMRIPAGCEGGLSGENVSSAVTTVVNPVTSTPQLVTANNFLYAFFIKNGEIRYRIAHVWGHDDASCRFNDDWGSQCVEWTTTDFGFSSGVAGDVQHARFSSFRAINSGDERKLVFAKTRSNGDVQVCTAEQLELFECAYFDFACKLNRGRLVNVHCSPPIFSPVESTAAELAYVYHRENGVREIRLAVFGTSTFGVVGYTTLEPGENPTTLQGWSNATVLPGLPFSYWGMVSELGSALSVATWPPIADVSGVPSDGTTCAAVREYQTDELHMYCTEDDDDGQHWVEVGNEAGSQLIDYVTSGMPFHVKTVSEPWLEFTRERLSSGHRRWSDPRIGRFALTWTRLANAGDSTSNGIGEYMHSDLMGPRGNPSLEEYSPAGSTAWRFDFKSSLGVTSDDSLLDAGRERIGVSVLDDSQLGATKALIVRQDDDQGNMGLLRLQWAFDGAVDEDYESHNDFVRMAQKMCHVLAHPGSENFVCE